MTNLRNLIIEAANIIGRARAGVAFTGAGISTPSGIPDFRSPKSGMWENLDPMKVASIYGFRQNPEAFYKWIHPLAKLTIQAQPNVAHYALVQMQNHGLVNTIITQNIDMLHTRAGSTQVYELHGHLREATCIHCFTVYDGETLLNKFLDDGEVPYCPRCGGVIKPNVILFGEQLPIRELLGAKEASRKADVMLIIGSSLEVAPASELPALAGRNGAKLIVVNMQPTPVDSLAHVVIHADAAEALPEIVKLLEVQH